MGFSKIILFGEIRRQFIFCSDFDDFFNTFQKILKKKLKQLRIQIMGWDFEIFADLEPVILVCNTHFFIQISFLL